jgi:hypothetical protein
MQRAIEGELLIEHRAAISPQRTPFSFQKVTR